MKLMEVLHNKDLFYDIKKKDQTILTNKIIDKDINNWTLES